MSTDSCLSDESIFAFVQGQLPRDAVPTIEEHLSLCPDCRSVVAETARFFSRDDPAETDHDGDATVEASVSPPPEHAPLTPGTLVLRYVISEVIGVGAAGVVYRAYDPELKRHIALKLLRTDHAREVGSLKERLLREAQAMAQLSHPNVVSVFDVGTYGEEIVIVLELVEGQTLARWLSERPRTWQEITSAFIDAGKGLAAAHAVQLVHRDFKPANVLVGEDGRVRVTDFGLARPMGPEDEAKSESEADAEGTPSQRVPARAPLFSMTATGEGGLAGTPVYMAPEQFRHRRADARTDQFSFCVALYLALYHRHPYLVGASKLYSLEQLADSVTQGQLQVPDTSAAPAGLFDILRRGLRADPKERFASMNELLDSLMSESTPLPAVSLRPVWRRPMLLIAAALGLVGLGALAMSARHPQSVEPLAAVSATPAIPSEPSIAAEISTASQVPTTSGAPSSAIAAVGSAKHPRPVRRPAPPPGRERYLDRLKDPF